MGVHKRVFGYGCAVSILIIRDVHFQCHQPITEAHLHLDHVLEHVFFSRLQLKLPINCGGRHTVRPDASLNCLGFVFLSGLE